jgi:GrpB-like predicted nucleotidyltransferase (UPF0157 family)
LKVPVEIVDYDPEWPVLFEKEKNRILSVIGKKVIAVEHVGSTSVPGLGAKPIVDIMVGIRRLSDAQDCIKPLESIGYEYVPEYEASIPERRYFHRGPHIPNKHYHLHMVEHNSDFWTRHLLFRDHLRTHACTASEYCELKKQLAAKHRSNREAYTEAKTSFIESALSKALSQQMNRPTTSLHTDYTKPKQQNHPKQKPRGRGEGCVSS